MSTQTFVNAYYERNEDQCNKKGTLGALVEKYNGVDQFIKVNATVETAVAARTT